MSLRTGEITETTALCSLTNNKSSDDKEAVLRDVSLTIQPGQKVCLCGRTGRYVHYLNRSQPMLTFRQWKILTSVILLTTTRAPFWHNSH